MNDRMTTSVPANRLAISPKIEIRKLRSMRGTDGEAYSCELWLNDAHVADVVQAGSGGMTDYFWKNEAAEKTIQAYVDGLPADMPDATWAEWETRTWPDGRKLDFDSFVAQLCDDHETDKNIRRECKNKTVFSLKSDKGALYSLKAPYSPAVAEHVKSVHGDDLIEILNENPKYASVERN